MMRESKRNYVVIPMRHAPAFTVIDVTKLEIDKGSGTAVFFRGTHPALVIAEGEYHSISIQDDAMTAKLLMVRDSYSD